MKYISLVEKPNGWVGGTLIGGGHGFAIPFELIFWAHIAARGLAMAAWLHGAATKTPYYRCQKWNIHFKNWMNSNEVAAVHRQILAIDIFFAGNL